MKSGVFQIVLFVLISCSILSAQHRSRSGGGSVSGQVLDHQVQVPIEYANVILFSSPDSVQVSGTITDDKGDFILEQIKPGNYYLEVSFIGYEKNFIDDVTIGRNSLKPNLGQIFLHQKALSMEGVEVLADKPPVVFQIDKKIVEVSKQRLSEGGTAVDALENVPSVNVDIEGNVQLRGSSNFTVLIDGRPSILDPSDALAQIPANSIRNIEIITNPSAKYDPDGDSGIVNVVMKKSKLQGYSGMVTLRAGSFENNGADLLFQSKNGKVDLTLGVNYGGRFRPGYSTTRQQFDSDGSLTTIFSEGDKNHGRHRGGVSGSIGLTLSENDYLTLGMRYGGMEMINDTDKDYETHTDSEITFYQALGETERSGRFYRVSGDYQHKFRKEDHVLSSKFSIGSGDMDELSWDNELDLDGLILSGRKSTEDGPSLRGRFSMDYVLPLVNKSKFEAGIQSRFGDYNDGTEYYEYSAVDADYVFFPEYSHEIDYSRSIHSLYAIYSNYWKSLGYQIGLRGEFSDRTIEVEDDADYVIDREDFYPTFHFSYQLTETQQAMASYSRRINRPRGWYLEPFVTWSDVNSVRQGNPMLDPEFTDSYELSYQKYLDRNFVSAELFYRQTKNKIDHIEMAYEGYESVVLRYPENIGRDEAMGLELMLDYRLFPWWSINLSGSVFEYSIESDIDGEIDTRESSNWSTRLNNIFSLGPVTQLQVNGRYSGESVTAQGTSQPTYRTDVALKHQFMDGRLTATLEYEDIFDTFTHENESTQGALTTWSEFTHDDPMIRFSLSYNINNFKPERNKSDDSMEAGDF